jgi:ubiquinone/menaquinone biosynthesis C-methylase UbiE
MLKFLFVLFVLAQAASAPPRNTWAAEYKKGTAEAFAARFEEPNREIFRYRAAITGLMQIKPGMSVGEVGAGSGFLSRFIAEKVGAEGRVFANELEPKMVAYMKARSAKDGVKNLTVVQGQPTSTGFEAGTLDAIAVVQTFSVFDHPVEMLKSIHESLKPNGLLLIVDSPREGMPPDAPGMDVEEILPMTEAAGFTRVGENGVVPGHYALILRKKS